MSIDSYYGIIGEKTDDRDLLGADIELLRSPMGTRSFEKNGSIHYNQSDIQKNSCSLHGAMTAYSGLTGYEFNLEQRKEIYEEALKRGFDPSIGWYVQDAVHLIYEWVNENLLTKVEYRRFEVGSPSFNQALRLGYMPVVGFRGNKAYNNDKKDDLILQGTEFADTTYGHCVSARYLPGEKYVGSTLTGIVDNYKGSQNQFYRIPTANWKKLVRSGIFFRSAYIYLIK